MEVNDLDLAACTPVNHLWGELVERLGLERSTRAALQALDLQAMRGGDSTMPVVLVETCGMALLERGALRRATGLPWPPNQSKRKPPAATSKITCKRNVPGARCGK